MRFYQSIYVVVSQIEVTFTRSLILFPRSLNREPKLKSDAVPHLNLPADILERESSSDVLPAKKSKCRNTRYSKRALEEVIAQKAENVSNEKFTRNERRYSVDKKMLSLPNLYFC